LKPRKSLNTSEGPEGPAGCGLLGGEEVREIVKDDQGKVEFVVLIEAFRDCIKKRRRTARLLRPLSQAQGPRNDTLQENLILKQALR
jgi:hypothetical protein